MTIFFEYLYCLDSIYKYLHYEDCFIVNFDDWKEIGALLVAKMFFIL